MTKYQLTSNYLINLRYKLKLSNSAGFIWNQAYPCDARGTKASVAHCSVVRFNSELFVQTTKLLSTWLYRLFPKYNTPVIRSSLKSRAISASPPLMWNWWKNLSVNLRPQLPFFCLRHWAGAVSGSAKHYRTVPRPRPSPWEIRDTPGV